MERNAKLQKLNHFRRKLPHMSATGLEAVLAAVKDEGMPEVTDRLSMRAKTWLDLLSFLCTVTNLRKTFIY